jgi:AraC-like DNA-binding protein
VYLRGLPHPSLAAHINYYWHVDDAPARASVHIVPSGTLEVVFNLREDTFHIGDPSDPTRFTRFSGAVVSGAHGRYFSLDVQARSTIVGIHFRPGGAFPLLGVPPGTLMDWHANLEAAWGPRAIELRERLCAARDSSERFRILDGEFMQRLLRAVRPRDEVKFALPRLFRTNARVDSVAADVDLSHRRFIEIFSAEVGVAPKVFSRVGRFQRALSFAKKEEAPDWPEMALRAGYFDQPHLIREFVALSGLSPIQLLQRSRAVPGHHAALAPRRGSNFSNTRR